MVVHNMQRRQQRLSEALSQWQDILEVTEACKTPKEVVTCRGGSEDSSVHWGTFHTGCGGKQLDCTL